jgi:hypothetical protein
MSDEVPTVHFGQTSGSVQVLTDGDGQNSDDVFPTMRAPEHPGEASQNVLHLVENHG